MPGAFIPPWVHGTDVLGAMHAGASLGLSARAADETEREFDLRQALARQEFEQNKQQAADALRSQSSQAAARLALAASNAAATAGYHKEAMEFHNAGLSLREREQTFKEQQALKKNQPFDPNSVANILVPGPDGQPMAVKTALGPNRWQAIPIKPPKDAAALTPTARLNANLRSVTAAATMSNLSSHSPFYNQASNALYQAGQQLKPAPATASQPPKDDARTEATALITSNPDKAAAIKARFKAVYGEDL